MDEFLLFTARTDHNQVLDEGIARKLLGLPVMVDSEVSSVPDLSELRQAEASVRLAEIGQRNAKLFDEEVTKLDHWSDDLKLSLEYEIKELDQRIKELKRTAVLAQTLEEKLTHQRAVRELERQRNTKRRELFDAQDAIDGKREDLIGKIEKQLQHTSVVQPLFTIRWKVR
jgi:hypothetical protein